VQRTVGYGVPCGTASHPTAANAHRWAARLSIRMERNTSEWCTHLGEIFAAARTMMITPLHPLYTFLILCTLVGCTSTPLSAKLPKATETSVPTPLPLLLSTNPPPLAALPTATPDPTPAPLLKSAIASCPVTLPNGKSPPTSGDSDFNLGNEDGTLFTIPWPEGTVIFARDGPGYVSPDGSLEMKWPWWRGVPGKLTIEGQRLDAPAPSPQAEINDVYGDRGFQPIGLIFPTQGCWEITGRVGSARLTFVTLVVKVPFRFLWFNWFPKGASTSKLDTSNLPDSLREIYNFSSGGELITEVVEGEYATATSYPVAAQQKEMVNGQPGTCVQGAFDEQQQWQDNADAGILEWIADGVTYRISHKGLGLRCDDLLSMLRSP
jgi:hypothetical protein